MPLANPHLGGYCNNAIRIILGRFVNGTVLAGLRKAARQGHLQGDTNRHGLCDYRRRVHPPNKNMALRQSFTCFMQVGTASLMTRR